MAQWFHVYYFELPGHGQSEPFRERFSSQQVAELLSQLADHFKLDRFNLMGFSFGGILAMRTFKHLSARIERLIFIAPCLDHRALPFSKPRLFTIQLFNRILQSQRIQALLYSLIRNKHAISLVTRGLQKLGRLDQNVPLEKKLLNINKNTIAVLNAQIDEILTTEFEVAPTKFDTPCYFAMSIHDPLLCFDTTFDILHDHFANVSTMRLSYPFHQPPVAFTYEELNQDFYETVDSFISVNA
jgi:pimeloyl-ACP methyl ester carboxylesterase